MEQISVEPWAVVLQLGVFFASIVVWLQIAAWWRRGQAILEYEPRSPVPWGSLAILPAIAFVLLALLSDAGADVPPQQEVAVEPWQAAQRLMAAILIQVMMGALVVGIAIVSQATLRDLGVVLTARQISRDFVIGVFTFLAAIAPVHLVQALLMSLTGQKEMSNNPLIKMITSGEPQLGVFLLATIAAVVVAPICEEILYRLILQGWLEKWEDVRLGWRELASTSPVVADDSGNVVPVPAVEAGVAPTREPDPPARGPYGLPYGWVPILISSALFAAAHYGYGPEPVPIFLLALILGYVYQRTHRILPCIIAHSLFNSLTMVTLWGLELHE